MGAETRDACQQGDATATVLLGQKADEEPSITLVNSGDDAVEGAMVGGGAAPGVLAAGGTLADVQTWTGSDSWCVPIDLTSLSKAIAVVRSL